MKPQEFLLACWHAFLFRLTGESTITVSTELDGRKFQELESAIGLFSKYIPLQSQIEPGLPFEKLVQQVAGSLAIARNWQEGFAWSHQESTIDADVGFDFADLSASSLAIDSLDACGEQFPLRLAARSRAQKITLELHFDASRFDAGVAARWCRNLARLVEGAAYDTACAIDRLPLFTAAERVQALSAGNQTKAEYPRARLVHELFEAQVLRAPDATALRCGEEAISYQDLNTRANQLAHRLRGAGAGPGKTVALCLERGASMIVALLGILKSGAAYVPIAGDQPQSRFTQQLGPAIAIVTEPKFRGLLAEFSGAIILADEDLTSLPGSNPDRLGSSEDIAYVIYTSGSTGVPKGVAVRHRNVVNYATFLAGLLQLEQQPAMHFATVSALTADLGNTSIFGALLSGGCLHVLPFDIATDAGAFTRYAQQYPVDVLKIVPSHLAALLNAGATAEMLPRRYLITGGEALTPALVARIRSLDPPCRLINHYGPTETTIGSLTYSLENEPERATATIPIGRPIANTRTYLLDAHREPVPSGARGELYIAGDGVAAGYLNDPARTGERFVTDLLDSAETMYRTGDFARSFADNAIEFLGRADDQVKIRGYRVELAEVEAVLNRHASVQRAVVIARPDERGDLRLIAYAVAHPDHAIETKALIDHLKQHLPEYMVPSAAVVLPKLPLTSNGKIDRQNLPEPEQVRTSKVAARTPTEAVIAGIWCEVLGRDQAGVTDNFFEAGGHSLVATQVISRMRRSLEVDPPLRLIFESPTIEKLARWVDETRLQGKGTLPPAITRAPRDQSLPLSLEQQRLWLINQIDPNSGVYNIIRALRMRGRLDANALERAINEIVKRHESQRTTFRWAGAQAAQVIAESLTLTLASR